MSKLFIVFAFCNEVYLFALHLQNNLLNLSEKEILQDKQVTLVLSYKLLNLVVLRFVSLLSLTLDNGMLIKRSSEQ